MRRGTAFDLVMAIDQQGYASIGLPSYPEGVALIDCAMGTNPLGMPDAMSRVLKSAEEFPLYCYPGQTEPESLKRKIAERYPSWNIKPENVLVSIGSSGLLVTISRLLGKVGSHFSGFSPQYTDGVLQFVFSGSEYRPVLLERPSYKLSSGAILSKLDELPAFLYIDRPHNPTGQVIALEDIEIIAEKAMKSGCWVISDEAYGDFMPDDESAASLNLPNVITCRSFSKGMGAANIRVGFAVSRDADFCHAYRKVEPVFAVGIINSSLAEAALYDVDFLDSARKYIESAKGRLLKVIAQKKGWSAGDTDVRVPISLVSLDSGDLFSLLAEHGISCAPGAGFFELDNRSVRLRVPHPSQLDELLNRIAAI